MSEISLHSIHNEFKGETKRPAYLWADLHHLAKKDPQTRRRRKERLAGAFCEEHTAKLTYDKLCSTSKDEGHPTNGYIIFQDDDPSGIAVIHNNQTLYIKEEKSKFHLLQGRYSLCAGWLINAAQEEVEAVYKELYDMSNEFPVAIEPVQAVKRYTQKSDIDVFNPAIEAVFGSAKEGKFSTVEYRWNPPLSLAYGLPVAEELQRS